ncbi:unnamed protein product [Hymenolepis diminuta]|uniref:Uncharacterized protein n=1 Tax=Hymenolepis diminuta TaxID=6216 RepID=A0A564YF49_HYMDI|nr:unnamed protein product [Hymenolepis diminuta]
MATCNYLELSVFGHPALGSSFRPKSSFSERKNPPFSGLFIHNIISISVLKCSCC